MTYNLSDYSYHLPEHLIAQQLAQPADSCRLMVVENGMISHHHFTDITNYFNAGDLLIFNDSKVVPARITLTHSDTIISKSGKNVEFKAGEAEIFFLRLYGEYEFEALIRRGKWFKTGSTVSIGTYILSIGEITEAGRMIHCQGGTVMQFLYDHGTIPLPPYIVDNSSKYDDYQPIVAKQEGSVAAPTAALHFTDRLLTQIATQGVQQASVTLHIGIGTFRLIDAGDVRDHEIHREVCQISLSLLDQIAYTHVRGNCISVVGTTSCRTIESLPYLYLYIRDQLTLAKEVQQYWDSLTQNISDDHNYIIDPIIIGDQVIRETQLYMYPGFEPKILNHLVTNFHLPQSTLLLMIASLIGYDVLIRAYEIAIQQEYQFYSFGDAMLLTDVR